MDDSSMSISERKYKCKYYNVNFTSVLAEKCLYLIHPRRPHFARCKSYVIDPSTALKFRLRAAIEIFLMDKLNNILADLESKPYDL